VERPDENKMKGSCQHAGKRILQESKFLVLVLDLGLQNGEINVCCLSHGILLQKPKLKWGVIPEKLEIRRTYTTGSVSHNA
jgi:hypothetical protein